MADLPKVGHDHRRLKRKASKRGTAATCRKGTMGLGRDLAIRILELSEEGARLLIKEQIAPETEVEVGLTGVGMSKPMMKLGRVVWCNPMESGFAIGVKFHERIGFTEFFNLT